MVFYINKQHGIFTVLFSFYVHFLTELFCPTDYNNVTTFWEKEELCEAYQFNIDVLLAVNIFINYFLLLAAAKFLAVRRIRLRILAASVLGAAYSLTMLMPSIPMVLALLMKLAMSASLVLLLFPGEKKTIFKISGLFLYYEFCFCRIYDGNLVFYFSARYDY